MPTPTHSQVGARIRNLREAQDLTQEDLARKLGVTQAAVSSWESGAKLDHVRLDTIAVALGATLIALLAPVDEPAAAPAGQR